VNGEEVVVMTLVSDPSERVQAEKDDKRRLAFSSEIREALVHLNDVGALQRLPLVRFVQSKVSARGPSDGEALQRSLREAIGALSPSSPTDPTAPVGRSHLLLTLRYLEGRDVANVLPKLALGRSQYYRDHQRALDELSAILWERWQVSAHPDRPRPRTNLPASLSSFIGRALEIGEVKRALASTRVLTLTGTGGCGKTRLAVRIAADLVDVYSDGTWLVELAPLTDPTLLPQTVAVALGLREGAGQSVVEALTSYLAEKDLLLLLDNCEHLIEAAAPLVEALLRACPRLRILTTSREALRVAGETSWRVPSLPLPPADASTADDVETSDAIRLFAERARAVRPDFGLTRANAAVVAQICRRLDGIPLAIELAAARARVLSEEQIARHLDDRFRFLTGGNRGALPRQQTLLATLDWSYALLAEPERMLFRRLSVFVGGFGLEAAEAVGGVLDLLTQLVDKSLVQAEVGTGEERYRLLETVRQYGWERLVEAGEATAARGRHRDWCVALAERAEPELCGTRQLEWLERLDAEYDNLRAAIEWSLEVNPMAALRLTGSLWQFWQLRGDLAEGRRWLEAALAHVSAVEQRERQWERARALFGAGMLARDQGDSPAARVFAAESLALFGEAADPRGVVEALRIVGLCLLEAGAPAEQVRPPLEESLTRARVMGDHRSVGVALRYLGHLAARERDDPGAYRLLTEALALSRQLGNVVEIGDALRVRGVFSLGRGDLAGARRDLEEGLVILRRLGHKRATGLVLLALGCLAHEEGDRAKAGELLQEGARLLREVAAPGTHEILGYLGRRAVARGQFARGLRLLATAAAAPAENVVSSILLASDHPVERASAVGAARAALGEPAFAAAWAEGQAMPLEQALEFALDEESG
jgi:predicted ATPase